MRWLILAVACVVFSAASATERQDQQSEALRALLTTLETALDSAASRDLSAAVLIRQAGLVDYVSASKVQLVPVLPVAQALPEPVLGQRLDLRLALTLLSQSYGPEGVFSVLAAQSSDHLDALVLRGGRATVADLARLLQENHLQDPSADGVLRLTVPVVVWSGASLVLGPTDRIEFSRPSGAFLANFGHLDIDGATLTSTGDANPASPSFMPFVVTGDGGSVRARNARFSHLGFGPSLTFAGFSVLRGILHVADRQNRIENCTFEDLVSASTNGATGVVFEGNRFRDMRGSALIIYRTLDAVVRANIFSGTMPTNAIRLIEGSAHGLVEGNVILGGRHVGILVGNDSTGAVVQHNLVWKRIGSGISVMKSDCGQVLDNTVLDNRQKGIEVRVSLETKLERNLILSNHNAGIWIAGQRKNAPTFLNANVFAANTAGITGAVGERIYLQGNDFSRQFPQFLGGDLSAQFALVASDIHGKAPIALVAAGAVRDDVVPQSTCTY